MKTQEHWDERYLSNNTPWDTDRHDRTLEHMLADYQINPCCVLKIGCGSGSNAIWLAGRGFRVTALDISAGAVENRFEILELSATHFDSDQPDPPMAWACLMRKRF